MAIEELDELTSVDELREYQKEAEARRNEIHAEFGVHPFSDEARAEFDELDAEIEEIKKRCADYEDREQRVREQLDNPKAIVRGDRPSYRPSRKDEDPYDLSSVRIDPGNPEVAVREYRDRAMRSVDEARFPAQVNREDTQARIADLIDRDESGEFALRVVRTGSPSYKRAFAKHICGTPLSRDEERALSIGGASNAGAGLAVPYTLDPTVIPISNSVVNPMRAVARVETLASSNEWRGITSTAITAQYRAEAGEASDGSPTIAQPTVRVQRADALVPFSRELGADWSGFLGEMGTLLGEAKDDLESTQFWSGVGTTVFPQGVFTGLDSTVSRVQPATNGAFAIGDLYLLNSALPPRHRPRGSYQGNLTNLNRIRAFDTVGTLYTTLDSMTPPRLLGQPIRENSAMPSNFTTNKAILIYGDFNKYLIVDRVGMEVEVIPNLFATGNNLPSGQRALFAFWRNSAVVLDGNAFRYLAGT